jgi:hypothetical protein
MRMLNVSRNAKKKIYIKKYKCGLYKNLKLNTSTAKYATNLRKYPKWYLWCAPHEFDSNLTFEKILVRIIVKPFHLYWTKRRMDPRTNKA